MACETCKWMNEPMSGYHCRECSERFDSHYAPMTNHDRVRMMKESEMAATILEQPWCRYKEKDDMTCGTYESCVECIVTWFRREIADASL